MKGKPGKSAVRTSCSRPASVCRMRGSRGISKTESKSAARSRIRAACVRSGGPVSAGQVPKCGTETSGGFSMIPDICPGKPCAVRVPDARMDWMEIFKSVRKKLRIFSPDTSKNLVSERFRLFYRYSYRAERIPRPLPEDRTS